MTNAGMKLTNEIVEYKDARLIQLLTLIDESIDMLELQQNIFIGYETRDRWHAKAYTINKDLIAMLKIGKMTVKNEKN